MPSSPPTSRSRRLVGAVTNLDTVVGGLALFALMALTCVAVFARYALDDPIFGIEDVATMLLVIVVAAAVVRGARHGSHVAVDVVGAMLPARVSATLARAVALLGALVTAVAAWALFRKGGCGFDCGAFTPNLEILHQPFYHALGVAMTLYALVLVREALGIDASGRSGGDRGGDSGSDSGSDSAERSPDGARRAPIADDPSLRDRDPGPS